MNQVSDISLQDRMIRQQVLERGIREPRVLEAMRAIPRDLFVPEEDRAGAFADRAAPIGHGQSISQPYMVALMTQHLDVHPEHRVLEIGTGCGYQTAILCRIASEVFSIERVKPLLDAAFDRLASLGIRNAHFRFGDGTIGWPEQAPFDRLLIAAGAPALPRELLLSQLKDGGVAVLPVGPLDEQMLFEVRRDGDDLKQIEVCACRFVKLIGREGW